MAKSKRIEMTEQHQRVCCYACQKEIENGQLCFLRAGRYKHHECPKQDRSAEGILDRVERVNKDSDKRDFGRAQMQVHVLRRFMTSDQLNQFSQRYNDALMVKPSPREVRPPEEDILLFEEHLKAEYSHMSFSEFARHSGEKPQNFAGRMYRVAYWKHVIKKEV